MMKVLIDIKWIKFLLGEKVLYVLIASILLSTLIFLSNINTEDNINEKQKKLKTLTEIQQDSTQKAASYLNQQEYENFYQQFPEENKITEVLAVIHEFADEVGINLYEGEYELKVNRNPLLMQYTIKLPTLARYQPLKQWIEKTEIKFPTLSLKKVELKRDVIEDDSPNVILTYQLLVKRNAVKVESR